MSASSCGVELGIPRRRGFAVSKAKKRSTWSRQDAEVGVEWPCQRGWRADPSRIPLVCWVARLSITLWTSSSPGTCASTVLRKVRISRARWWANARRIDPAGVHAEPERHGEGAVQACEKKKGPEAVGEQDARRCGLDAPRDSAYDDLRSEVLECFRIRARARHSLDPCQVLRAGC
jgi:hypothetical protein